MTGARSLPLALVVAVAGTLLHGQTQTRPTQTFRTATDVVFVDVSVRERGRAVTDLKPEDFVLTDNGVRQRIDSVEATAVPIDLTLVVDVSGNPRRPWSTHVAPSKTNTEIQEEVREITALLRPADRMRLLAIDSDVQQVWPMSEASALPGSVSVRAGGMGALFDALATALLHPVEPARRHVVIARTKGVDTISSVDAAGIKAIAERSDALLHVVAMEMALDNESALSMFQCTLMGYCWATGRFWVPFQRRLVGPGPVHRLSPDGETIASGAEATGGGLHQGAVLHVPTLTSTFKKTFDDFRNSYVLRYTPTGVPQAGWHKIEVSVPKSRGYTVRSRPGYLVEEPVANPPAPDLAAVPRSLPEFITAYEHRAFRQLSEGIRHISDPQRMLEAFEAGGNPWPATPKREAAFMLELAEPALFSRRASTREAAHALLTRFSRLVRQPLEPDVFERYWYFAALTMLEGTIRPAETEAFANRAIERFPDEPRFLLSRAIALDQRSATRFSGSDGSGYDVLTKKSADYDGAVRTAYEGAIPFRETGTEARIRLAWFFHRTDQHQAALKQLNDAAAQPIGEPALRYLHQLFLGHVLNALNRRDEAVKAFQAALSVVGAAQSARVGLMNALLVNGNRTDAEALAEQIQTNRGGDMDPWWMYWQGQYRLQPQAIARIRELSR